MTDQNRWPKKIFPVQLKEQATKKYNNYKKNMPKTFSFQLRYALLDFAAMKSGRVLSEEGLCSIFEKIFLI